MQRVPITVWGLFVLFFQLLVSEHHAFIAPFFRPKTQSSMQFVRMHLMTGIKIGGWSKFYDVEFQSRYLLEWSH